MATSSAEWKRRIVNWLCCRGHNNQRTSTVHHPAAAASTAPAAAADQNPPLLDENKPTTARSPPTTPSESNAAAARHNPALLHENKPTTTRSPPTTPSESIAAAAHRNPPVVFQELKETTTTPSQSNIAATDIPPVVFEEEETTLEQLDKFLAGISEQIDHLVERADHSSSNISRLASQWVNYKGQTTSFMQTLPTSFTNEIAATGKTILLPLLKRALGGLGGVHWMAVGFSLIAWSLETIDTNAQNWRDCLQLLRRTVSLLESTRKIWQASCRGDDLKVLQDTVEKTCQCAIICSSMMQGDGSKHNLLRFLKASTIKDSIANLEKELDGASEQIRTHMEVAGYVERPRLQRQYTYTPIDGRVGGDETKQKAMTLLNSDVSQGVVVSLLGMGGIGKSTLGMAIFSEFQRKRSPEFRCCCVELPLGIREDGLQKIQKQIMDKLSRHSTREISSLRDGVLQLKEELQKIGEPVFLYLDNVLDSMKENWLPEAASFPKRSRILVTTRHKHVCGDLARMLKIKDYEHIIEVKKLDDRQAKVLLWRQLEQVDMKREECLSVIPRMEDLEREVLKLCDGLPLALTVVGGHIAHSEEGPRVTKVWDETIKAMREAVPLEGGAEDPLYSRLQVSIDLLDPEIRKKFLDIVAFAVGWPWSRVERLVSPSHVEILRRRSLVEKTTRGDTEAHQVHRIEVHDVLKAMGQRMVKADKEEIRIRGQDHLDETSAFEKVVGLMDVTVEAERLQQMPRLRLLQGVNIEGDGTQQAAKLRHLSVVRKMSCRTASWPIDVSTCTALKELDWSNAAENLRDLEVLKVSQQLEMLTIRSWKGLRDVGAIICLRSLKGLIIRDCWDLRSLPEGVAGWTGLTSLGLSGCGGLESLPAEGVAGWTGLTSLDLSDCRVLRSLPEGVAGWTGLTSLDLSGCEGLRSLPEGVAGWRGLTSLDLNGCGVLRSLPEGVAGWTGLTSLDLSGCGGLRSLPEGVAGWTGLTSLDLSGCEGLRSLPEGVAGWTGLTSLDLSGCGGLRSLPEGVAGWTGLTSLDLSGCGGLQSLPRSTRSLTRLEELRLEGCCGIQAMPDGMFGQLTRLRVLCGLPRRTVVRPQLKVASNSRSRSRSPIFRGAAAHKIGQQRLYFTHLFSLPPEISKLPTLCDLSLQFCCDEDVEALPSQIHQLTGLRELSLTFRASNSRLPDDIVHCTSLTSLWLFINPSLQTLPSGLSGLQGLHVICREYRRPLF